jgi:lipid A 3-O-deacylase
MKMGMFSVASRGGLCAVAGVVAIHCGFAWREATAAGPDRTWTLNVTEENDSFMNNSDKHYTQGLRISLVSAEQRSDDFAYDAASFLADTIFLPGDAEGGQLRWGVVLLGHSLFTPRRLTLRVPDPSDRPYAGWLYAGANLYRETATTLDRAGLLLGVVGPAAAGDYVQNNWHHYTGAWFGGDPANGWRFQLRNEPGVVLSEERKWKLRAAVGPIEIDALPEVNFALGNVFSYLGAGGMVRVGQRLGVDWGPPRIQPGLTGTDFVNRHGFDGHHLAWYAFVGAEVRVVGRNIFLDGNSFARSASVDKEILVADLSGGISVLFPYGRVAASYIRRTSEFKRQDGNDQFLSITLGLHF